MRDCQLLRHRQLLLALPGVARLHHVPHILLQLPCQGVPLGGLFMPHHRDAHEEEDLEDPDGVRVGVRE